MLGYLHDGVEPQPKPCNLFGTLFSPSLKATINASSYSQHTVVVTSFYHIARKIVVLGL